MKLQNNRGVMFDDKNKTRRDVPAGPDAFVSVTLKGERK